MADVSEMMDLGFSVAVAEKLTERGVYTADVFKSREPAKFEMCVRALAMGFPINKIARSLGCAWETVKAVQRQVSPESLRDYKSRLSGMAFNIVEQRLEQLMEDPEAIKKLGMIDLGILIDKSLVLAGEASVITESRVVDSAVVAFQEAMRAFSMVSPGGEVLAKGSVVVDALTESGGREAADGGTSVVETPVNHA